MLPSSKFARSKLTANKSDPGSNVVLWNLSWTVCSIIGQKIAKKKHSTRVFHISGVRGQPVRESFILIILAFFSVLLLLLLQSKEIISWYIATDSIAFFVFMLGGIHLFLLLYWIIYQSWEWYSHYMLDVKCSKEVY